MNAVRIHDNKTRHSNPDVILLFGPFHSRQSLIFFKSNKSFPLVTEKVIFTIHTEKNSHSNKKQMKVDVYLCQLSTIEFH